MTPLNYFLLFHFTCPIVMWLLFYFLYHTLHGDNTLYQPIWIVGVFYDIYFNIFWGTLICIQLPNINRLFFSARLDDLIKNGTGFRKWLAIQIVGRFLEPFDMSTPKQHTTYGLFPVP